MRLFFLLFSALAVMQSMALRRIRILRGEIPPGPPQADEPFIVKQRKR